LANLKQAKKRAIQSESRRKRNAKDRSKMRTFVKRSIQALDKDKDSAKEAANNAFSILDNMARKGIIHRNKAARLKRNISKRVKSFA